MKPMTTTFAILVIAAMGACGGGGGGGDQDATDTTVTDTATDEATDTPADTGTDSGPDTTADTEPDTEPDTPMDVPDDWPKDVPDDWPVDVSSACAAAGGFCTAYHWDMCPPGYEPTAPDMVLDCGGHCCIVAPYSTCSAAASANCIVAESCSGCWGDPYGTYSCEEGRICCTYVCE